MNKLLSIIIPVYNNASIGIAIDSVNKRESIELIVVDGGSSQETKEVINSRKNVIDIFVSEPDKGISDAINKGISLSSGKWIFVLAADDQIICDPLNILKKYDDDSFDMISGSIVAKTNDSRYYISNSDINLNKLYLECSLRHPATFFKKSLYSRFGKYDLKFKCANDHEIFLRFILNGAKVKIIDDFIVLFAFGGISTSDPRKGFYEDQILSDLYHVPFFKSRIHLLKRLVRYHLKKIVSVLHIPYKKKSLSSDEIKKIVDEHSEVVNKSWIS